MTDLSYGPSPCKGNIEQFYVVVCSRAYAGWDWASMSSAHCQGRQANSERAAIEARRLIDGVLAPGKQE